MEVLNATAPESAGIIGIPFIRPVLAMVNLRPGSDKLVVWAWKYAYSFNAPLVIVHIVHDPASSPGFYSNSSYIEDPLDPMQVVAERMMESFLDKLKTDYPDLPPLLDIQTHLFPGLPKTRIGEIAEKLNARLLVIGRQKCSGMKSFLKGSITGQLAKNTNITITVV